MRGYYAARLSGDRLRRCYDLAPPRVRRYLEAEIAAVLERVGAADRVLELGCGYGRLLAPLVGAGGRVCGIDSALDGLRLARRDGGPAARSWLVCADAADLPLAPRSFDAVLCLQNGISAFQIDRARLVREAVRVTCPGGRLLVSSYASAFWEERLAWFRLQAAHGLIGAIDEVATGDGVIVCEDGFRATTVGAGELRLLLAAHPGSVRIVTVDDSCLLGELVVDRGDRTGE